jgi:hypothetical protein
MILQRLSASKVGGACPSQRVHDRPRSVNFFRIVQEGQPVRERERGREGGESKTSASVALPVRLGLHSLTYAYACPTAEYSGLIRTPRDRHTVSNMEQCARNPQDHSTKTLQACMLPKHINLPHIPGASVPVRTLKPPRDHSFCIVTSTGLEMGSR